MPNHTHKTSTASNHSDNSGATQTPSAHPPLTLLLPPTGGPLPRLGADVPGGRHQETRHVSVPLKNPGRLLCTQRHGADPRLLGSRGGGDGGPSRIDRPASHQIVYRYKNMARPSSDLTAEGGGRQLRGGEGRGWEGERRGGEGRGRVGDGGWEGGGRWWVDHGFFFPFFFFLFVKLRHCKTTPPPSRRHRAPPPLPHREERRPPHTPFCTYRRYCCPRSGGWGGVPFLLCRGRWCAHFHAHTYNQDLSIPMAHFGGRSPPTTPPRADFSPSGFAVATPGFRWTPPRPARAAKRDEAEI